MPTTVFNGRVEWWARHYKGEKYHALLCDPPYHLTSITERFGKGNAAPAKQGTDGLFARASRGFMGKTWDGGDVAFRPDTWAALAEHLHPGAFGMAFASSRGWHRMAVAIEDAGLIIHPTIFNWAFGSGFPKATRIDTQIDAAAGAERPIVGEGERGKTAAVYNTYASDKDGKFPISAPATAQARIWEGHRYGLQAMKPAVEPIILFQKPYSGRPVDCITQTGAGALNIDAARIATGDDTSRKPSLVQSTSTPFGEGQELGGNGSPFGRWPANFVLTEDAAKKLNTEGEYFHTYDWQLEVEEQLASADPVRYEAKASSAERNAGLKFTDLPRKSRLQDGDPENWDLSEGKVRARLPTAPAPNHHPTVKPIGLTEWLAKLLLPPKEYGPRRILVPFAGSSSEMIGAYRAGWEHVYGIEMTREYVEIARARLAYWRMQGVQLSLFDAA